MSSSRHTEYVWIPSHHGNFCKSNVFHGIVNYQQVTQSAKTKWEPKLDVMAGIRPLDKL